MGRSNYTIEVIQGRKRWFWHVKAQNGQILCASESYYSRWNAIRAAKRLARKNDYVLRVQPR